MSMTRIIFPNRKFLFLAFLNQKITVMDRVPHGRTALCAELPCSPNDSVWGWSDAELGKLVCESLEKAEIPIRKPIRKFETRRLRYAYPIYREGYEMNFCELEQFIGQTKNLLTYGRQGLFAHDNTHHALFMAYSAVKCLDLDGKFDFPRWQEFKRIFETHVVED